MTEARYQAIINPPTLAPHNRERFRISQPLAAKLEAVASARIHSAGYVNGAGSEALWAQESSKLMLAMSVNASSHIEHEDVHADFVPLLLNDSSAPLTMNEEMAHRLAVNRAIYQTCFWALTAARHEPLSVAFIEELHRRMFSASPHYAQFAGQLKSREVAISGQLYAVKTLPAARTRQALALLCARTNHDLANNGAEVSPAEHTKPLLTIIAEFVVDFLAIHPFQDGNGRTARLLSTCLLERAGYHFAAFYPLDAIIDERRHDYFFALFSAQQHWYCGNEDLTGWVEFYIEALLEQWMRAHRNIRRVQFSETRT